MRKKTLLYIFFAGLSVLLIAGFVLRQQFYGNAVKTERELFVSSRADYRALVDSLLPAQTPLGVVSMPGASIWPRPSSPATMCSSPA